MNPSRTSIGQGIPLWRDERALRIAAQVVSAIAILGLLAWGFDNLLTAANQRGLGLGFSFVNQSAGFPIGESLIPYTPSDPFIYAFLVGILNTVQVAVLGIVLATALGTVVGLARLSQNWLLSRLALAYIEAHRNIPLLVLLFIWYRGVFTAQLPQVANSLHLPGYIYLNQRGVYLPKPVFGPGSTAFVVLLALGILLAPVIWSVLRGVEERSGRRTHFTLLSLLVLVALPAIGWAIAGRAALSWDVPVLETFNFKGGVHLTPEFSALLVGLVTYTAAFIAEVVRAGIQAVDRGQTEAARALGLSNGQVLRLVVIPQALRVIIPPLISQYLNLTKNSSLAFFIGYPELFAIGKIMINQAGRAVPVFVMIMAAYLAMSLLTSAVLNVYNRRVQLVEH